MNKLLILLLLPFTTMAQTLTATYSLDNVYGLNYSHTIDYFRADVHLSHKVIMVNRPVTDINGTIIGSDYERSSTNFGTIGIGAQSKDTLYVFGTINYTGYLNQLGGVIGVGYRYKRLVFETSFMAYQKYNTFQFKLGYAFRNP